MVVFAVLAGCTGTPAAPSYNVDRTGRLTLSCAPATASENVLVSNATYTVSRITFHTQDGDVAAYLAAPEHPVAGFVYVPGSGERADGHGTRMIQYARSGIAFFFVDVRGNGGETPGLPFGPQMIQADYARFEAGKWPQYYLTVCDLSAARNYLSEKYHIPVCVMGSSNGGRYAAVAAAADPEFAGYIGISTSDWGVYDSVVSQGITGDPVRFAASLEPSTGITRIAGRPVWLFHSRSDTIVPFTSGKALYEAAGEPRTFREFSGGHGINDDVDEQVLSAGAQIYGTRG